MIGSAISRGSSTPRDKKKFVRLSLAAALSTMQVTVRYGSVPSQFLGLTSWVGQGPSTSLPLPPTSQEDLRPDGCLE
ncbi:hypothetical protein TNCV_3726961 [Trichonephila clavipes]|nr:hypothetical protein TNCV_3726961 [Trichonephila clavipes]